MSQQVEADPAEVSETRLVSLDDLRGEMLRDPDAFTQWFRDEIAALDFFSRST